MRFQKIPTRGALAWGSALGLAVAGCATQVTSGAAFPDASTVRPGLTLGLSTNVPRRDTGVVGARLGTLVESGIAPKHVILHGGWDFRFLQGGLVLEPGFDLGGGSPMDRTYDGVGGYMGTSGTARVRFLGTNEEPAFNVLGVSMEAVLMPRLGWWMPPEGTGAGVTTEWAVEGGFRIVVTSDLFTDVQGKVREPGESR